MCGEFMSEIKYKSKYHKLRIENGFSIVTNSNLELFFLDDISSAVYLAFKEEKTVDEVVEIMLCEFLVEKEVLFQDILGLIEYLGERGLLEVT